MRRVLREAVASARSKSAVRNELTFRGNLAKVLHEKGLPADEFEIGAEDYRKCQEAFGSQYVFTLSIGFEYARHLLAVGQHEAAIELLQPFVNEYRKSPGPSAAATASRSRLLARVLRDDNRGDDAVVFGEDSIVGAATQAANSANVVYTLERELRRLTSEENAHRSTVDRWKACELTTS